MAIFTSGIPRLFILLAALAVSCLVSPATLGQGPDLCVWRSLSGITSCPACGSTRALAAFFHGQIAEAWAFNPNVVVTAPCLLAMLVMDLRHFMERIRTASGAIPLPSSNRRSL